jgi:hypothetical protein
VVAGGHWGVAVMLLLSIVVGFLSIVLAGRASKGLAGLRLCLGGLLHAVLGVANLSALKAPITVTRRGSPQLFPTCFVKSEFG